MGNRFGFRLAVGLVACAALAAVGFYGYNLGVAQGIAESGRAVALPGGGVPVVVWTRPWGFGFGFFPFFPLLFVLFWVFVLRGLFGRRAWRGVGAVRADQRDRAGLCLCAGLHRISIIVGL